MGLPISELINNYDVYGLPTILIWYHGFLLKIKPDNISDREFNTVFWLDEEPVCYVSKRGDVELIEKIQPANYLVKCKKCYSLIQTKTGACLCELFWPE